MKKCNIQNGKMKKQSYNKEYKFKKCIFKKQKKEKKI